MGSAPSIHGGASFHDVPERDEGDNYEKEEEDEDNDNDVIREDTPKDEDNEEEEDNEDDAQFVDNDPIPPKCWTWSQQAQQDEQESSLVTEILSDDEKTAEVSGGGTGSLQRVSLSFRRPAKFSR